LAFRLPLRAGVSDAERRMGFPARCAAAAAVSERKLAAPETGAEAGDASVEAWSVIFLIEPRVEMEMGRKRQNESGV
jgi:hypothetical protein